MRRTLGDRVGVVGIDGVGADVEKMRRRHGGEGAQGRLRHVQVGDHLVAVLGRRDGRDENDGIGGLELGLQLLRAVGREQVHVLAA